MRSRNCRRNPERPENRNRLDRFDAARELVSVHRLPNALTGRTRRCNRLHETFSHQSHARHPRLSTEASERHGRRRAGAHACQPRIHRCAARPAQGTRGGVRPAGAHRGVPETYLSDVESSAPTAHRRLTPPHPPTSVGVIPLARRRRRHHDARPRAVRPRRSVSHLSAWARAWGLPKRRRRLSSSRATFVVRQSESPDPAERFGFSFASRPGANRALTFPRHASPRQSSYKHVKHPRHPVCDVHLAKKRLRRSGPPPPRVRGVERRPGRRRRAGVF